MIKKFKHFIKENKSLFALYKKLRFIKDMSPRDFFDFKKIALFKKVCPYTMVGYKGLSNAYELSKNIEKNKINGAFVECGVWRGGCAAVMAFIAERAKSRRKIWLFDSFEGLPEPTDKDGLAAEEYAAGKTRGNLETINKCVGPLADVKKIFFEILRINPQNVIIKEGWFQDTLPSARGVIGPIAILRLDGDWYESTRCCLDNLYNMVIPGGYIIIDDYGYWEGARRALDEFFLERRINPYLIRIDDTRIYFKKP